LKCDYCKKEFTPVNTQQKYCSRQCRYDNANKVNKERNAAKKKNKIKSDEKIKKIKIKTEATLITPKVINNNGEIDPYYLRRKSK